MAHSVPVIQCSGVDSIKTTPSNRSNAEFSSVHAAVTTLYSCVHENLDLRNR